MPLSSYHPASVMNFNGFLKLIPALSRFASDSSSSSSASAGTSSSSYSTSSSSSSDTLDLSLSEGSGKDGSEFGHQIYEYSISESEPKEEGPFSKLPSSVMDKIFQHSTIPDKLSMAATSVNFRRVLVEELVEKVYAPIGRHGFHLSLERLYKLWQSAGADVRKELEQILMTRGGFRVLWVFFIDGHSMNDRGFDGWLRVRNMADSSLEMLTFILDNGPGVQVTPASIRISLEEKFNLESLKLILDRIPNADLYDDEFIMEMQESGVKDHILFELAANLLRKGGSSPHLGDVLLKFGSSPEEIIGVLLSVQPGTSMELSIYAVKKIVATFSETQTIFWFNRFPSSLLLYALARKTHISRYMESEIDKILAHPSTWCHTSDDLARGIRCCKNDNQMLKLIKRAADVEGLRITRKVLDKLIKGKFGGSYVLKALERFPDALFKDGIVQRAIMNCGWPHHVNLAMMSRTPGFKLTAEVASQIKFNDVSDEIVVEYAKYIEDPLMALRFALILTNTEDVLRLFVGRLHESSIDIEDVQPTIDLAAAHHHPDQNIDLLRGALLSYLN